MAVLCALAGDAKQQNAMHCHAVPCTAMLCHAMPCYAMLCHATIQQAMPYCEGMQASIDGLAEAVIDMWGSEIWGSALLGKQKLSGLLEVLPCIQLALACGITALAALRCHLLGLHQSTRSGHA